MPPRETMKAVAMSVGFGLAGFLFLVLSLDSGDRHRRCKRSF
jgi:hypothetical protein